MQKNIDTNLEEELQVRIIILVSHVQHLLQLLSQPGHQVTGEHSTTRVTRVVWVSGAGARGHDHTRAGVTIVVTSGSDGTRVSLLS